MSDGVRIWFERYSVRNDWQGYRDDAGELRAGLHYREAHCTCPMKSVKVLVSGGEPYAFEVSFRSFNVGAMWRSGTIMCLRASTAAIVFGLSIRL